MTQYPGPQPQVPQAAARKKKPWYLRWWSITIAAVLVMSCFGALLNGGDELASTGEAGAGGSTGAIDTDSGATAGEAPAEEPETDYFADTFPVFAAVTESGSGDSVITLPAAQGIITADHSGSANFILTVLDEGNAMSELPVNAIGSYEGTTAYGVTGLGGEPATLEITADGDWEITIAHVADAPEIATPLEAQGDRVFRYTGDATVWQLSHSGDANFIVTYISDSGWELLVNEIGSYDGTVPVTAGPALVIVNADGSWSLGSA